MNINSIKPNDLTFVKLTPEKQQHFMRFTQMCYSVLNIQTDIQLNLVFLDRPDLVGCFSPSRQEIRINPFFKYYRNKSEIYRVIAHEVIHFKQYLVGDLRVFNKGELLFKGKRVKHIHPWVNWNAYRKTPHEAEAYQHEYPVAKQAMRLLKSRQKNT